MDRATRDGRGKDGRREIMARKGKGKFEGGDQRGKEVRKGIGGEGENMVENWRSRKSESEAGMWGGEK